MKKSLKLFITICLLSLASIAVAGQVWTLTENIGTAQFNNLWTKSSGLYPKPLYFNGSSNQNGGVIFSVKVIEKANHSFIAYRKLSSNGVNCTFKGTIKNKAIITASGTCTDGSKPTLSGMIAYTNITKDITK